jgi:ribosomal protein S18 acetylase RimI-like enzyme
LLLEPATSADASAIATLRNAVAAELTQKHGKGWWSGCCTERGVRADFRDATIYVVRERAAIIATLRLATRKPWAIDRKYFTPFARPLYLTSMAVAPLRQRQGLGRACVTEATDLGRAFPAQSICLDAFDHADAGAGGFYRKCGFREVGRATYRTVPLIYFELLL